MSPISLPPASIDAYIAGFSPEIQILLQQVRETIHQAAPDAQEKISYGMPTFYLNGNLVHFAAYKQHLGFYPAPSGIEQFKEALADYVTSKGAIQFPLERPIPFDLIREITLFRVGENLAKKPRRG